MSDNTEVADTAAILKETLTARVEELNKANAGAAAEVKRHEEGINGSQRVIANLMEQIVARRGAIDALREVLGDLDG
jgi:hypothetical protein